ncbi:MAG: succinate dehydrogenase cytochrome b subunit [Bacteroidales bacterium]|nr:succinate dehydrogenase cytochrome b subunit [Bacteroidales bacterium]
MWLSNSSVGRKLVMAITGACLVLFVTFHCLMNAVAICWPAAYNSICEFLGANWYALIASAGLALLILIHIIYAVMLTLQNRKARGSERYAISKKPASVEWSSQNMLVLGIVILAFLVVHLIQFWAKMQLQEIRGVDEALPPAAGTLFIQGAFQQPWTLIVYGIGFIALWFHLNHGFWSMFQSIGWNNTNWMPRLKKIGLWWTTIVVACFFAQGIVFTVKAHEKYYLTNETLREQYKDMVIPMIEKDFGPDAAQLSMQIKMMPYEQMSAMMRQNEQGLKQALDQVPTPEFQEQMKANPQLAEQVEKAKEQYKVFENVVKLLDYLESADDKPNTELPAGMAGQPY